MEKRRGATVTSLRRVTNTIPPKEYHAMTTVDYMAIASTAATTAAVASATASVLALLATAIRDRGSPSDPDGSCSEEESLQILLGAEAEGRSAAARRRRIRWEKKGGNVGTVCPKTAWPVTSGFRCVLVLFIALGLLGIVGCGGEQGVGLTFPRPFPGNRPGSPAVSEGFVASRWRRALYGESKEADVPAAPSPADEGPTASTVAPSPGSASLPTNSTGTIPAEDLFAANAEWRDGHQKAHSIIFSSMATISVISSSILVRMILRSSSRLTTTYHRILVGMTIGDIVMSLSLMSFGAMMPSDVSYLVWNARGNQATCNVAGFLSNVGWSLSVLYSCSLNSYSLAVVKYHRTDRYVRTKMEPFLHGVPFVIALGRGIALLATGGYNSNLGTSCIAPAYDPPHCVGIEDGQVREGFEIPCGRGWDGPGLIIGVVTFFVLAFGVPIFVVTTLAMMFRDVSRQERRMARYSMAALHQGAPQENNDAVAANGGSSGLSGTVSSMISSVKGRVRRLTSRSSSIQQNSNSRRVMHRAQAYSGAYFLTWSWFIIYAVLTLSGVTIHEMPLPLRYLNNIFNPLQGFWNLMIFIQPSMVQAKRSHGGNLSWCQAFAVAFGFSINVERIAPNDAAGNPHEEEQGENETQAADRPAEEQNIDIEADS